MTMEFLNKFMHVTFNSRDIEIFVISGSSNLWRHIALWELQILGMLLQQRRDPFLVKNQQYEMLLHIFNTSCLVT